MREIKFRAIDKETNKMVYGFYCKAPDDAIQIEIKESNSSFHSKMYYIKPETLGQYSGIKDKNAKEMYEGDIVLIKYIDEDSCMGTEYTHKGVVSYGNSLKLSRYQSIYPASFCLISKEFYKEQALLYDESYEYEIIGNIYQNKQLLED